MDDQCSKDAAQPSMGLVYKASNYCYRYCFWVPKLGDHIFARSRQDSVSCYGNVITWQEIQMLTLSDSNNINCVANNYTLKLLNGKHAKR